MGKGVGYGPFIRCGTCGEYDFMDRHTCPPIHQCRFAHDDEEGWRTIHAQDAEEAAAKFCEQVDQEGDYHVIRNGSATVLTRRTRDDAWRQVEVSAETRPHYMGRAV